MKFRIITCLIISSLLFSCTSAPDPAKKETVKKENKTEHEVVDIRDFIDLDDNTVKFLFTAKRGDKVNFFLGESKESLELKHNEVLVGNRGLKVTDLTPGVTYYYQIESIRDGVSITTDVESFVKQGNTNNWVTPDWAKSAVFYEIFVRSFYDGNGDGMGDFVGLKEKIPYLKELGVDALWLMPINQSPTYHGYDVTDYYDVEKDYGTKEEFLELVQELHNNDIKVIMDLVINHSSTKHPWFQNAVTGLDAEYRDWYVWANDSDNLRKKGPWGGTQWYRSKTGHYNAVFWDQMPDMNLRNEAVRAEFKKIASYWLDPNGDGDTSDGVDGFRLDAALHIDDEDKDVSHNWWQEFNTHVKSVNSDAILVGENWASTNKMASFFEDLEASFNFSFANNILEFARGKQIDPLDILSGIHKAYAKYNPEFVDATFITNHDQNRVASVLNGDMQKSKLAATLLLTMPGTPFLYYGEEIGMTGKKPDENIREPFNWYSEMDGEGLTTMNKGGFNHGMFYSKSSDGISLEEQSGVEDSIYEHYRKLISIRKNNPMFAESKNYQVIPREDGLYIYRVTDGSNTLTVIHNNNSEMKTITLDKEQTELLTDRVFVSGDIQELPPYSSVILQ